MYPSTINQQKQLPNDTAVLVLGIISIVLCGVGLVTGIIALTLSSRGKAMYRENPEEYLLSSYNNLNAGRICAIIGLCLSSAIIIFYIAYFMFIITMVTTAAGASAAGVR